MTQGGTEEEVWTAISAFQQILEAIPNDRASLEALAHAFEQIGDHTQARDYLLRLGNVMVEERDADGAQALLDRVDVYAASDGGAAGLAQRIRGLVDGSSQQEDVSASVPAEDAVGTDTISEMRRRTFNMAEELSCAWNLMQAGELEEEEYASVVQDLSDMSSREADVTVSVLHVLEGRTHRSLERIINYFAHHCGTPYISLTSFDLQSAAVNLLPMDFIVRRGTLIFDLVGKEGMAVVMNPFDEELRKDIEMQAGIRCHYYVTLPSEFDLAVGRVKEMQTDTAARQE